jgi:hypothetical protein
MANCQKELSNCQKVHRRDKNLRNKYTTQVVRNGGGNFPPWEQLFKFLTDYNRRYLGLGDIAIAAAVTAEWICFLGFCLVKLVELAIYNRKSRFLVRCHHTELQRVYKLSRVRDLSWRALGAGNDDERSR